MARLALVAAMLACLAGFASAGVAAPPRAIVLVGKSWSCTGPVDVANVTVTIGPGDRSADAVHLRSGCTGHIGSITVDQWHGDGIRVGVGAHDLEIGSIAVHCYAHDAGKHQDGVQVMGGRTIRFDRGYVGSHRQDLFQGPGSVKPVWSFASLPPGLRASRAIHA